MTDEKSMAIPVEPISPYMPGIDPKDFRPMEYRLVQSNSQAAVSGDAQPGDLFCPQLSEAKKIIRAVALIIKPTRTLWAEVFGPPRCSSDDGEVARPGAEFQGRACRGCEFYVAVDRVFSLKTDQRRKKCLPGYTMLCIDLDTALPFLLRANGTSVGPIQRVIQTIYYKFDKEPFQVELAVGGTPITNKQGQKFFVLNPRIVGALKLEDQTKLGHLADALAGASAEIAWAPNADTEDAPAGGDYLEGALVGDPIMRYTTSGKAVINIYLDREGPDGNALPPAKVVAWEKLAEELAEKLAPGVRVRFYGRWSTRTYTNQNGEERTEESYTINRYELPSEGQPTGDPPPDAEFPF